METQSRSPQMDGLELIRPPVSYAQRTAPELAFTAKTRPSVAPKYTVLPIATGDDSTFALVRSCQSRRPFERSNAVTDSVVRRDDESLSGYGGRRRFGPAAARPQRLSRCCVEGNGSTAESIHVEPCRRNSSADTPCSCPSLAPRAASSAGRAGSVRARASAGDRRRTRSSMAVRRPPGEEAASVSSASATRGSQRRDALEIGVDRALRRRAVDDQQPAGRPGRRATSTRPPAAASSNFLRMGETGRSRLSVPAALDATEQ